MTIEQMADIIQNTAWAKAVGYDSPVSRSLITDMIGEVARHFWYSHHWSFRKNVTTFSTTAGTGTYKLDEDVEEIITMTYDDEGYDRYIRYRDADFIEDNYDNTNKSGSIIYYWSEYSRDENATTIEIVPVPDSSYTVTVKYYRTFDNLEGIPQKYHSIILTGVKGFLLEGNIGTYLPYIDAIQIAKYKEKPHRIKKHKIEKDRVFKGELK